MAKLYIIIFISVLVLGIATETASLIRLKNSIDIYGRFWKQKANLGGDYIYVALGDSSAQGIGASQPMNGYVGLLAGDIEQKTGKKVQIINLSVSGAKISDVIDHQIPQLNKYKPDLITISIGGNDVANNLLDGFGARFDILASKLPRGTLVANVPYFGGRIRKNSDAIKANEIIRNSVEKYHLVLVDLQSPLREQNSALNYSSDLFHPSDRAYRIWETAFWKSIVRNSLVK